MHDIIYDCLIKSGIIVWMCFRATIVARLSQKNPKLPFKDLNGIPNTDYLVTTAPIDWAYGKMFSRALPGTIYHQIFKNNMDIERSFIGAEQGTKELIEYPLRAHFDNLQIILQNKGTIHDCDLKFAWKSSYKIHLGIVIKKAYPHFQPMNMMVKRLEENGLLRILKKRNFLEVEHCEGSKVSNIGMEKVISIFAFLGLTSIFSLFVMLSEFIHKHFTRNSRENEL